MSVNSQGDAPPPYQSYQGSIRTFRSFRSSSNSNVNFLPTPDPSSSPPTLSRRHSRARTDTATRSRWFPANIFGLFKPAKQVRAARPATQDCLRDFLTQARPSEDEWLALFNNCTDTCSAQGLSFSDILQEPFVEGHLPIYWAILKRPTAAAAAATASASPSKKKNHKVPASDPDALVFAILDASLPLNALSVADASLGCVTVSDNRLFVRLGQRYEAFIPRSGTDKVLLGGIDAIDPISVKEIQAGAAGFNVRFSITRFQLRMRVSKQARIQFIARERLWYLAFSVAGVDTGPPQRTSRAGEWLVSLGLEEYSSPTWVDARLSIVDRSPPPCPPSTYGQSLAAHRLSLPLPPKHPHSYEHRNASLHIKTSDDQISYGGPVREIVVSLDKFWFGPTQQNDIMSFVDADGTLNAELEVNLQNAGSEVNLQNAGPEVNLQNAHDTAWNCVVC